VIEKKTNVGRWLALAVIAVSLLLIEEVWCSPDAPESMRSDALIRIGEKGTLDVEVADTSAERTRGLSHREDVPWGTGMLFHWDEDTMTGFWMADTYVELSIAFIDASWEIQQIEYMTEPMSRDHVGAHVPYRYALEVPYGWFDEQGITVGDTLTYTASE